MSYNASVMEKIKTLNEIVKISAELKSSGKIVVTTNGSFDLLHAAHVRLFERAKELGDTLIVLLNSDSSVRGNKEKEGRGSIRPYVNEKDRAYVVAGLQSVDYVTIFDEEKPLRYLEIIKPSIHVKGGSGVPERYREEREFIESLGGKYFVMPLEEGYSSTNIEKTILDRNKGVNS